jgi:hypothetical protein
MHESLLVTSLLPDTNFIEDYNDPKQEHENGNSVDPVHGSDKRRIWPVGVLFLYKEIFCYLIQYTHAIITI